MFWGTYLLPHLNRRGNFFALCRLGEPGEEIGQKLSVLECFFGFPIGSMYDSYLHLVGVYLPCMAWYGFGDFFGPEKRSLRFLLL